jgi:hypothetical protein
MMLDATDTNTAPWHIVRSDNKSGEPNFLRWAFRASTLQPGGSKLSHRIPIDLTRSNNGIGRG